MASTDQQLSDGQIARYHEQGYLIPDFRLPQKRIDELRTTLDKLIADNPGVRPEKLVSAHIEGQNNEGVSGSGEFLKLAMEPAILDMVEQLIGPDIILWGCHVFCKPGGDGLETPWHQDGEYWPIRPLATCTVWVALEESTIENGCLRVIPGSHKARRTIAHEHQAGELVLNMRARADAFDENESVALELEPGQMSMHDIFLLHGATANTSGKRRTGAALRYMPATSVFERNIKPVEGKSGVPVAFATRPLWQLRGRDISGHNDFHIGHPAGQSGLLMKLSGL